MPGVCECLGFIWSSEHTSGVVSGSGTRRLKVRKHATLRPSKPLAPPEEGLRGPGWRRTGCPLPSPVPAATAAGVPARASGGGRNAGLVAKVKVKFAQRPTLCGPMDYTDMEFSRPGYWSGGLPNPGMEARSPASQVASLLDELLGKPKHTGVGGLSLLHGSSRPRSQTGVSCLIGRFFTSWATREALLGG